MVDIGVPYTICIYILVYGGYTYYIPSLLPGEWGHSITYSIPIFDSTTFVVLIWPMSSPTRKTRSAPMKRVSMPFWPFNCKLIDLFSEKKN